MTAVDGRCLLYRVRTPQSSCSLKDCDGPEQPRKLLEPILHHLYHDRLVLPTLAILRRFTDWYAATDLRLGLLLKRRLQSRLDL